MHPGILFADIGQFKEIGIETGFTQGVAKKRLMGSRGAGRHHHPIQTVFIDGSLDFLLAGVGTGVFIADGQNHLGQCGGIFPNRLGIYNTCNVRSTVADKNTDS